MLLPIWTASSLVGDKMIAWVFLLVSSANSNIGRLKAAVLPVPVCAKAFKSSVEVIICGIAFSWITVGFSYPKSVNALLIGSFKPNSKNVDILCFFDPQTPTCKS